MFLKKKESSLDFIIVGLGNPGKKYEYSRHNVGYRMIDAFCIKHNIKATRARFQALCAPSAVCESKVLVMKPITYMNLSGISVREAANYYKVSPENIIVVYDDISLEPGVIRIRAEGSAGGHNGIKSIIEQLGTEKFPRVKIGVGKKPRPDYDLSDWVLAMPSSADRKQIESRTEDISLAIEAIISESVLQAQSKFNG